MGDTPRSSFTDLTLDLTKFMHTKLLLVHGLRDGIYLYKIYSHISNVHSSAILMEQPWNALSFKKIDFKF